MLCSWTTLNEDGSCNPKETTRLTLVRATEASLTAFKSQYLVMPAILKKMVRGGSGRESQGGYICILVADSYCCKTEINTIKQLTSN